MKNNENTQTTILDEIKNIWQETKNDKIGNATILKKVVEAMLAITTFFTCLSLGLSVVSKITLNKVNWPMIGLAVIGQILMMYGYFGFLKHFESLKKESE